MLQGLQGRSSKPSIVVTGIGAARDRWLLEAYFAEEQMEIPYGLTPAQANQLAANKLSVLPRDGRPGGVPNDVSTDGSNLAAEQARHHLRWDALLAQVSPMLDELGVRYVSIKAMRSPCAMMSDVDFLMPVPADIARFTQELERAGFALFQFRHMAHPLKIMASSPEHGANGTPQVDIYPDGMWIRKHVLGGLTVIAGRRRSVVRGTETWVPAPEDDLYLVATHSFVRGDINLSDLDHGARILLGGGFDWDRVLTSAERFGCQDAIYVYLRLLIDVATALDLRLVPHEVISELERARVSVALAGWLDEISRDLALPVRIPLWHSTVRSAWYHLPAVRRQLGTSELLMDAATHGLSVATRLFGRN